MVNTTEILLKSGHGKEELTIFRWKETKNAKRFKNKTIKKRESLIRFFWEKTFKMKTIIYKNVQKYKQIVLWLSVFMHWKIFYCWFDLNGSGITKILQKHLKLRKWRKDMQKKFLHYYIYLIQLLFANKRSEA